VNGLNVPLAPAFFRYLMAADAADQMQEALTAVMLNCYAAVYRQLAPIPEFIPLPTFPPSDAVAEHTEGTYPVAPVVITQAPILLCSECSYGISRSGVHGRNQRSHEYENKD
jgi:hypothetical protein